MRFSRLALVCFAVALGSVAGAASLEFDLRPAQEYAHVRATAPARAVALPTNRDVWPDGTVTYFNASPEHEWAVQQAVGAWNASGARVRFIATTAAEAELLIKSDASERCGEGRATLGYTPQAVTFVFRAGTAHLCDRYSAARVLAHELGHVLGLTHLDATCAVMNSTGDYRGSRRCPGSERWEWRCRLVERADARAAVDLYGGTAAPTQGPAACPLYRSRQAPPARIRLVRERTAAGRLAVSFVRPANAETPRFLGDGRPSFALSYRRGACAEKPSSARYRWTVAPGREQLVFERSRGRGAHCLRVWAADRLGRLSAPSTLALDIR